MKILSTVLDDKIGLFYPDTGGWYLRDSLEAGAPDYAIGYGFPGDR